MYATSLYNTFEDEKRTTYYHKSFSLILLNSKVSIPPEMVVLTSVQVVDILGVLQTNINTTITLADIFIAINKTATPAKQNDHLAHFTQQPNGSYILSPQSGFHTMVGAYNHKLRDGFISALTMHIQPSAANKS